MCNLPKGIFSDFYIFAVCFVFAVYKAADAARSDFL